MDRKFVWIDPTRFEERGELVEVDGVKIVLNLSPSNRPTAVYGRLLKRRGWFEVGFEYTDNEAEGSRSEHGGITFVEGRYSGKVLRIEIPIGQADVIELQTKLAKAAGDRTDSLRPAVGTDKPYGQYLNSRAATEVLGEDRTFRRIAEDLVTG